jgi:hypothetical protein
VVVERFAPGHPDAATAARLAALAAAAGPHLQRVLSWDRAARVVVYEAGVGAPLAVLAPPLGPPLAPRALVRLIAELAAALAPLHAAGKAHGAVDRDRVLIDDHGGATLVCAGLGPMVLEATPADDVAACLALAEAAAGAPLAAALLPELRAEPSLSRFADAAALAAFADELRREMAVARGLRQVLSTFGEAWPEAVRARAAAWGLSDSGPGG